MVGLGAGVVCRFALAGLVALGSPTAALAQSADPLPVEAPAAGGPPITVGVVYTADVWRNEGGVSDGWRYLDNLDLTVAADLERIAGLRGARAFLYLLYNNGASLSELTGDAFGASNIETGVRALRVYEAWIERDFAPGVSLRVGLYDLNSEFDALESSALFIGSAHGIGTDISQSGPNGPSIFPVTSLAARLALEVLPQVTLRAAVLDAVPGDPAHPSRTAIVLGQGALTIGEADWHRGSARFIGGAWRYSEPQPRLDGSGKAASQGIYLRGESCLGAARDCAVSAFFRAGIADPRTNSFVHFLGGGVNWTVDDSTRIGIAVAHADVGNLQRSVDPASGDETALELTAAQRLSSWLTIQPDLQLIRRANATGKRQAAVIGLRVTIDPAM